MSRADANGQSKLWWQSTAFRINRWYALAIVCASLVVSATPYVLGQFIPCAEFMEVQWTIVAFLCVGGVGVLNIVFSFAPAIESAVPAWGISLLRKFLLVVLPVLALIGALSLTFLPFWYALLNDPVLLCD